MSIFQSIASEGTLTINQALSPGADIAFLNQAGDSGTLILTAAPFAPQSGPLPAVTGMTGFVENFLPGDHVILQDLDQTFAELNSGPWNFAQNVLFDAEIAYASLVGGKFFIAPNGTVTDNFCLPVNGSTTQFFDDIRGILFGDTEDGSTLTVAMSPTNWFLPTAGNITTDGDPNPCFAAGTRILTTRGEIAVEQLAAGDFAISPDGAEREIIWIGQRRIDISRHGRPEAVRPIIIEAGALADDCPCRRLVLSPDHALLIEGVLVQAKHLENGVTIRHDRDAARVHYFHVELDRHDIMFAEGAPAESYLDTGHRGVFDNSREPLTLHPDLMQQRREKEGCAPLCLGGETLSRIRRRLISRAEFVRADVAMAG